MTGLPLDPKVVATLKARAALVGVVLHVITGDRGEPLFIASRWGLTRSMTTLDEVETLLKRFGG